MVYNKITHGFVIQQFNNVGECIGQEFVAGDIVEYETEYGDPINVMDMPKNGDKYFPFEMEQPQYGNYIVLVGNPIDGINVFGPFRDYQDASDWAEGCDNDNWITELEKP